MHHNIKMMNVFVIDDDGGGGGDWMISLCIPVLKTFYNKVYIHNKTMYSYR